MVVKMDEEIDIQQCFKVFFKRKWMILLAIIVSCFLSYMLTQNIETSQYSVCIKMIDKYQSQYEIVNQKRLMSYVDIAKSNTVLKRACQEINHTNLTQQEIADMMEVTFDMRSNSLQFIFQSQNKEDIITVSHTVAETFVTVMKNISGKSNIEIALKPDEPQLVKDGEREQKENRIFYIILFLAVLLSGIFLYGVFDEKLQTLEDLEKECDFFIVLPEYRKR